MRVAIQREWIESEKLFEQIRRFGKFIQGSAGGEPEFWACFQSELQIEL
jgi:hypothetical protein